MKYTVHYLRIIRYSAEVEASSVDEAESTVEESPELWDDHYVDECESFVSHTDESEEVD